MNSHSVASLETQNIIARYNTVVAPIQPHVITRTHIDWINWQSWITIVAVIIILYTNEIFSTGFMWKIFFSKLSFANFDILRKIGGDKHKIAICYSTS